jgi:4-alpha-glucanotransferase
VRFKRAFGVLLHPTSLPGAFGIGDLGPAAYRYVDWLARTGASWWQVLPLNPPGPGWSPYAATSTFAGNPLLVSPERLLQEGLLQASDLAGAPALSPYVVEYETAAPYKTELLRRAWARFGSRPPAAIEHALGCFQSENTSWLQDAALFAALARAHGGAPWHTWSEELALREQGALARWRSRHEHDVRFEEFCLFLFARQWHELRRYARERGVRILGDIPLYVADNSADVWAHRELFRLDRTGRATAVAGVPPDYFSATGQLWGNPLYDWRTLVASGFAWWIARLRAALALADVVRLDHFRGFAAYWEVPAGAKDAVKGRWVPGPGRALFDAARAALGDLPFVAEDLGVITDDVIALRDGLELPGMAVLQFAFAPSLRSAFLPHRHPRDLVVYTGTHDNNTTVGWYLAEATEAERDFLHRYLGCDGHEIHWDLIRAAFASVADLAVVPHQDIAGLGSDCRMNTPATVAGNWRFRITEWMLGDSLRDRLADLAWLYGRRAGVEHDAGADGI